VSDTLVNVALTYDNELPLTGVRNTAGQSPAGQRYSSGVMSSSLVISLPPDAQSNKLSKLKRHANYTLVYC
jgi:hypothetical protein